MKRTNKVRQFAAGNRRLLLMTALFLLGCISGVSVYASWGERLPTALHDLLVLTPVDTTLRGVAAQFFTSCFQTVCLLLLLFFSGLSVCGAPVILLVPVFWGLGLGMSVAHQYAAGLSGVLCSALLVVPHGLLKGAALSLFAVQSLQLSAQLAGQLLPRGAHCGGLWQAFRAYLAHLLLLLPLVLLAAVIDVGLRLLLLRFF